MSGWKVQAIITLEEPCKRQSLLLRWGNVFMWQEF
jgi:hypothetical protein